MQDAGGVAPAVRDGWLAWEVEGKPVSVRLRVEVVSRLGMAVQEGFKALRRRGLETGGLLIGTKREAGDQIVVDVDDFEPIESEHANGPSYCLSDADRQTLKEKIAAREAVATGTSIVGFYRSHTRRDFAITEEDASLFSTYFRKASDVFLLIKSNEDGLPTGGFIIREGGKVLAESPYAQFPLDWRLGIASTREAPIPVLPSAPAASLPSFAAISPRAAAQMARPLTPPPTNRRVMWPVWLATAAAVVVAVGLSWGFLRRTPDSIPAKPGLPLALSVTAAGNSLRLSWNHQVSNHGGHAVLWIKDGQEQQRFDLDSKQLSEGSVAYWPTNSDVTFRFELVSGDAKVTESVRSIGGPSKAPVVLPTPAAVPVAAPAAPAVKTRRAAARPPKQTIRKRTGPPLPKVARTFALPQAAPHSTPVAPVSLPDPPPARAVEAPKDAIKPIVPTGSVEVAESSVRVGVEPVSGSFLEHVGRNIPLLGKRYRRADYVPPSPVHNPTLPYAPPRKPAKPVNIDVKAHVNPNGKVDLAELSSKVAPTDLDLAALALSAAQQCEFAPARTADGTVPGVVIFHFQFNPDARMSGNQALTAR
jgi:hypothetical protein